MRTLKLAVVGAGHLGKIHARLLSQMADVQLVGVADPVASAREQVAADCGTRPVSDYRELLDQVDAAVIAVPTRFHHPVALDFLRHKIPLLVEKPLASTVAEADEIVSAARGVCLQVGHIERFNPAFVATTARVNRPRYLEAVRASGYTGRSIDIGVVHDLMIHDLDLLLSLVDAEVTRVSAMGVALLGKHEDAAQARIEFANGCVAHLSASRVSFSTAPKRQMQIWSEQGFATIDFGAKTAHVVSPNAAVQAHQVDFEALAAPERASLKERLFSEVLKVEPLELETRNALADELADFCDSIRNARSPRVTGQHGRNAVAVAEMILNSIATHAWQGREAGPRGPLALPQATVLRGPHWKWATPAPVRREAG